MVANSGVLGKEATVLGYCGTEGLAATWKASF
jgi:hypothetical protein